MPTVCDPHFLIVDDVMVAFLLGLCLDIGNVRAGARLSDTVSLKYGKQTIKCSASKAIDKKCYNTTKKKATKVTYTHQRFFDHT